MKSDGGGVTIPKKSKLNIRFHNPNTPEATADYISKILIQVNQKKIEKILQEEASKYHEPIINQKGHYVG